MADFVPSRSAIFAACVAMLALSGCAAPSSLATPSPAPSRSSTDRGTSTPAASASVTASASPTGVAAASPSASASTGASGTPSALADVPGRGGAVPAPAQPTSPPAPGPVAVSSEVQAFIDAARTLTARGEAVTATSLGAASPAVAALLAAGSARVTGDALQVYVTYEAGEAAARAAVESAGGTVERTAPEARLVQASVPVARLTTLAQSTAITRIRLPEASVR